MAGRIRERFADDSADQVTVHQISWGLDQANIRRSGPRAKCIYASGLPCLWGGLPL